VRKAQKDGGLCDQSELTHAIQILNDNSYYALKSLQTRMYS